MSNPLSDDMKRIAGLVKRYRDAEYPGMAGRKTLAFIDGNFRKQSWEGMPWKRRRNNKKSNGRAILILRGILRRGTNFKTGSGEVIVYNYIKYAAAHNNGFTGTVAVRAHNRKLYGKFKSSSVKTKKASTKKQYKGNAQVKAFSRNMRLSRRQFMPTAARPSPTLIKEIKREIDLQMLKILKR